MSFSAIPFMYLLCGAMSPTFEGEYYARAGPWCGYELYWQGGRVIRANGVYGGYMRRDILGKTELQEFVYLDYENTLFGGGAEVYEDIFH